MLATGKRTGKKSKRDGTGNSTFIPYELSPVELAFLKRKKLEVQETEYPLIYLASDGSYYAFYCAGSFASLLFGNGRTTLPKKVMNSINSALIDAYLSVEENYFGLVNPNLTLKDGLVLRIFYSKEVSKEIGKPLKVVGIFEEYLKGRKKGTFKDFSPYLEKLRSGLAKYFDVHLGDLEFGKFYANSKKHYYFAFEVV